MEAKTIARDDSRYLDNDYAAGSILRTVDILQLKIQTSSQPRRRRSSSLTKLLSMGSKTSDDSDCFESEFTGYWTVSKLSTVAIGRMDSTSVVSFKNPAQTSSSTDNDRNLKSRVKEFKDGEFKDDNPSRSDNVAAPAMVRYNTVVQVYTNFGKGGRFLSCGSRLGMRKKGVVWTSDKQNPAALWEIRKTRELRSESKIKDHGDDDKFDNVDDDDDDNDETVLANDVIHLYNVHTKMYATVSNNSIVLSPTASDIQVRIPSLAFVVRLGQKTDEYRQAAAESRIPSKNPLVSTSTENFEGTTHITVLPQAVIHHILSFFTGTQPRFFDVRKESPELLQRESDGWCIKQKREGVKWLRSVREVCKLWREVSFCG